MLYGSLFFTPPEAGWTCYVAAVLATSTRPNGAGRVDLPDPPHRPVARSLGAINFFATIANMRAPGMGWGRLPLFVWSILDLLDPARPRAARRWPRGDDAADRPPLRHATSSTRPTGGSPLLWQHLFWFFGHPEVYIMVLPGFGIISEVLPVFARKPIFGYKAIAAATAVIAFLGLLVWAHHMFSTPSPTIVLAFFMLSLVPDRGADGREDLQLGRDAVARDDRVHDARCCSPSAFIGTFLIGGITGIFLAVFPVDWQLHGHLLRRRPPALRARSAARCSRSSPGIYYWFPKMTRPAAQRAAGQGSLLADAASASTSRS